MEQPSELMKDLTYDFAADIIDLVLPSTKLDNKDIDFFEPIILGMFLVGYTFYLSNAKSSDKKYKEEKLDSFHQEMHNSLINDVCIGVYKINNIDEIHNFSDNFNFIKDQRFIEYFPLINPDSKTDFLKLSSSFSKHFFRENIMEQDKVTFDSHLNITIALYVPRMEEKLRTNCWVGSPKK